MSIYLSLLAGIAAKAYDDINDNPILKKLKNDTLLEYLKGVHYVSFTTISLSDPAFFYFSYMINFLHNLTNESAYKNPYEHSLLYSFLLLFVIVNKHQTKIYFLDWLLLLNWCFCSFMEPIIASYFFKNKEFSRSKLILRTWCCAVLIVYFLLCKSITGKHIFSYFIGYFLISAIVQYYSVYITAKKKHKLKKSIRSLKILFNKCKNYINIYIATFVNGVRLFFYF